MKRIVVTLLVVLICMPCISAPPASKPMFIVIAKNGDAMQHNKKQPAWKNLQRGDTITAAEEIKIPQGGYVNLLHSSGRNLELKTSGVIPVAVLLQKIAPKPSPIYQRLYSYIYGEIIKSNAKNDAFPTAGVERSICITPAKKATPGEVAVNQYDENYQRTLIPVIYPKNTYTMQPVINFSWIKKENLNNYELKVLDRYDVAVFTKKVFDSTYTIDLQSLNIKKGECYFWFVEAGFYKSNRFCIVLLPENEIKAIKDTVAIIEKEFKSNPGPMLNLALASFYASKNLTKEAAHYYREAANVAPQIKDYADIYKNYLNKIGMADSKDYLR